MKVKSRYTGCDIDINNIKCPICGEIMQVSEATMDERETECDYSFFFKCNRTSERTNYRVHTTCQKCGTSLSFDASESTL